MTVAIIVILWFGSGALAAIITDRVFDPRAEEPMTYGMLWACMALGLMTAIFCLICGAVELGKKPTRTPRVYAKSSVDLDRFRNHLDEREPYWLDPNNDIEL